MSIEIQSHIDTYDTENNVINLDDYRKAPEISVQPEQWMNALALCVQCSNRWISIIEIHSTNILTLECPRCGDRNSFISILPTLETGDNV